MAEQPTPVWHPISKLPLISAMVDEMVDDAKVQLANLEQARHRPYVLDDEIVSRILSCYSEQSEMIPVYREQVVRWQKSELSDDQAKEVARLEDKVESLHEELTAIITLATKLRQGTIDTILRKSDAEVGLDWLNGKLRP